MNIASIGQLLQQDIPLGTELKWSHFTWVDQERGFSPGEENILIGKKVNKNLKIEQIILQSDLI